MAKTNRILPAKDKSIGTAAFDGDGREVEYRIEGSPGLVLAVMAPRADGAVTRVWRAYYSRTKDGKRTIRKVRIGRYPQIGLAEARRRAAEIGADVERGKDVVADKRAAEIEQRQIALTFADLVNDYVAAQRSAGIKSVDDIERALRRDALPVLGRKAPCTITDVDIEGAVDAVAKRGAKAMARHLLVYLRGVFNFALVYSPQLKAKYVLTSNPASFVGRAPRGRMGKYGRSRAKERALADAEIVAVWSALDKVRIDEATRSVIRLLILTGQRLGEVRGAQIEELADRNAAFHHWPETAVLAEIAARADRNIYCQRPVHRSSAHAELVGNLLR